MQFPSREPLYIELGRTLVLEAELRLQPNEKIILRTWERINKQGEVRVAEGDNTNNHRIFVERNGASLRIEDFQDGDYGSYKITVTASDGSQTSAERQVLIISK